MALGSRARIWSAWSRRDAARYRAGCGGKALARFTRRAALATLGALGAGSVLGLEVTRRGMFDSRSTAIRLTDRCGFMGADSVDMSRYMEMFDRHRRRRIPVT